MFSAIPAPALSSPFAVFSDVSLYLHHSVTGEDYRNAPFQVIREILFCLYLARTKIGFFQWRSILRALMEPSSSIWFASMATRGSSGMTPLSCSAVLTAP